MALGDLYVTAVQLKAYLGLADSTDDTRVTDAATSISREIEEFCGRQFNDAGSATTREVEPCDGLWLDVDDFSTATGLVVKYDSAGDGTYATTVSSANFKAYPLNGVVDGQPGWPFWRLKAINYRWPTSWQYPPIQVTARWGWTAVPAPVYEAAKILASETFGLQGARFGVASYDHWGPIRVRDNPMARRKLEPYRRHPVLVA